MCPFYDPRLPDQCTEEDAADVREKARANFCDYFVPNPNAFEPGRMTAHQRAESELDALFGSAAARPTPARAAPASETDEDPLHDAESLFKR
jgi:hypothetical protein